MTNNIQIAAPQTNTAAVREDRTAVDDLDLTPDGLADTPARQEDPDSIVHTGNS
jgi:hypothetical protein